MAITKRELQISNQSYTNKDFEAVYLELLDYAEKLSKRFSPANSNESDPFVILLKLVAFATDKVNYNADKNILEAFMTSCTQEKSMRELCEMLGYSMHYYEAASTNVIFKYKFTGATGEENILIPKFSTVSDSNTTQYVTIEDAFITTGTGTSGETPVLQGKRKVFTVLGSEVIQLENISDNKLYFPELYVAQNGVFIQTYVNETLGYSWERVENLNTEEYGSRVFKFGFDTILNRPYIEFPEWLDEVINSGLHIDYIVTDGVAGNVGVKELTTVTRLTKGSGNFNQDVKDEDIMVSNSSAANNGKDIETISEAYEGFKKTIGTFDTLVTCRDYANYIYRNLENICSNIQVSDRRDDINYSVNVVQHTEYGTSTLCKARNITANEICLYPLKPLTNDTYTGLKTNSNNTENFIEGGYDDAYRHLMDTRQIKNRIENSKSISHDYKEFAEHTYNWTVDGVSNQETRGDLILIKDNYELNAIISTSYKVNILEQLDIKYAIKNALIQAFNSRTMDWGEEIPFENIVKVIMNADRRITNVSLMQPDHSLEFVEYNSNALDKERRITKENTSAYNFWIDYIITKNIVEGRVAAFEYDEDFKYDYVEKNSEKPDEKVTAFSSYCNLTKDNNIAVNETRSITLKANQVLQFLGPSLIVGEGSFPYGVHYNLKLPTGSTYIPKDSNYQIGNEAYVAFLYTEDLPTVALFARDKYIVTTANGEEPISIPYNIIEPNFDMYSTQTLSSVSAIGNYSISMNTADLAKYYPAWHAAFAALGIEEPTLQATTIDTKDEVVHKIFNEEVISENKKCYWFTNEDDNEIKWDKSDPTKWKYLLRENEYFFYSDIAMTSLFSFGPGTTLYLKGSNTELEMLGSWKNVQSKSIDEITEKGLESLKTVFYTKGFSSDAVLNIKLNEIITLTTGDLVNVTNNSSEAYNIPNNTFSSMNNIGITYKFNTGDEESAGSLITLPDRSSLDAEYKWNIRALLDIDCGPDLAQKVEDKEEIKFKFRDNSYITYRVTEISGVVHQPYLKLSINVQKSGGLEIPLGYYDVNLNEVYPSLYKYEYENAMVPSGDRILVSDIGDSYVLTAIKESTETPPASIESVFYIRNVLTDTTKGAYISVYRNDLGNNNANISFTVTNGTVAVVNKATTTTPPTIQDKETFILKVNGTSLLQSPTLTITISGSNVVNARLFIDKPLVVDGSNSLLKSDSSSYDVVSAIKKYYGEDILKDFYMTAELDDSKKIELSSRCTLDSPAAFLDYNNVANKWLLAKIDFDNSNIDIAANCKLKG